MSASAAPADIVVVKLGGSVLTRPARYRRCARQIARQTRRRPATRWVVVASARFGVTDQLERRARSIHPGPDPAVLDLLWLTGELRSVATLTLHLHALGVNASGLNAHQCGLEVAGADPARVADVRVDPLPITQQLCRHAVVVVPGFFARGSEQTAVSLGRGGSDLTAVLLAAGLGARRCELVKDVPGYFSKDPHRYADARPLPRLTFAQALRLAAEGCDLVQPRALVAAAEADTPLVVRGVNPVAGRTLVTRTAAEEEGPELAALAV